MSATGLDVFDKTLQTTNSGSIKFPRRTVPTESSHGRCSWSCLHNLRDRMPVDFSAHLGAELPLLVRDTYYDQFEPAKQPTDWDLERFVDEVSEGLSGVRPVNPRKAIRAVFSALSRHVPRGQISKVQHALPRICARPGCRPRNGSSRRPNRASWVAIEPEKTMKRTCPKPY
jgi:uncharacterized protein (DUF2267 family)